MPVRNPRKLLGQVFRSLLGVMAFVTCAGSYATQEPRRDAIVFINGMLNDPVWYDRNYEKALWAVLASRAKYGINTPYVVVGARNMYAGTADDVIETAYMVAAQRGMTFEDAIAPILAVDSGYSLSSPVMTAARLGLLTDFLIYKPWVGSQADVDGMVTIVRHLLAEKYRVLLLGHSQGTLFANLIYSKLNLAEQASVEIVPIGNLTDKDVTGLGHITDTQDVMVNLARSQVNKNVLAGNLTNANSDTLRHSMPYYTFGDQTRGPILDLIDAGLRRAKSPEIVQAPTVNNTSAIQCGSKLEASGGESGLTTEVVLGDISGRVKVDFEAYQIKDSLQIKAKDSKKVLFDTYGLVAGRRTGEFDHEQGKNGRSVIVNVGGKQSGTAWTLVVGCPGQEIDTRKLYRVSLALEGGGSGIKNCRYEVFLDSQSVGKIGDATVSGGSLAFDVTGGDEGSGGLAHNLNLTELACTTPVGAGLGTAVSISLTANYVKRTLGSPGAVKPFSVP